MMMAGKGGGADLVRPLYSAGSFVTGATSTFSSVPLGNASANRRIIVFTVMGATTLGQSITSVTVGGVSLTKAVSRVNSYIVSGIWYGDVPSGASGDIVVTRNSTSGNAYPSVAVASLYRAFTVEDTISSSGRTATGLSVSAGSIVLGLSQTDNLSPVTGASLVSSPVGLDYDRTLSVDNSATGRLFGWIENSAAGTYSITGDWDDPVSSYATTLGASLVLT